MKPTISLVAPAALLFALSACVEIPDAAATPPLAPTSLSAADRACLEAVIAQTNNRDAVVQDSLFAEAGTLVTVGVGPQRAPWTCLSSNDGVVQNVQSATNEGTL